MFPTYLVVLTVAADVGLAVLLLAGIAYAARADRAATARGGGPFFALAAGVVSGWAALVFVLASEGVFESTPQTTRPVIGLAVVMPIVLGGVLLATSGSLRRMIARIPLHWLVGVQSCRIAGGLFVIAHLEGEMPAEFALPAGIGDVLVGLAAPVVAYLLATRGVQRARSAAVAWSVFGIADLVVAVSCGFLTAPSTFQQLALDTPNAAITSYPFVLIPTFAVPVFILLHVAVLTRLRSGRAAAAAPGARPRPA